MMLSGGGKWVFADGNRRSIKADSTADKSKSIQAFSAPCTVHVADHMSLSSSGPSYKYFKMKGAKIEKRISDWNKAQAPT